MNFSHACNTSLKKKRAWMLKIINDNDYEDGYNVELWMAWRQHGSSQQEPSTDIFIDVETNEVKKGVK
eukprot:3848702-Lingulodinium_polyedra.AAC.1